MIKLNGINSFGGGKNLEKKKSSYNPIDMLSLVLKCE